MTRDIILEHNWNQSQFKNDIQPKVGSLNPGTFFTRREEYYGDWCAIMMVTSRKDPESPRLPDGGYLVLALNTETREIEKLGPTARVFELVVEDKDILKEVIPYIA